MNIDALLPWMLSVALLTVRLTMAVALSPLLSSYGVPAMVRTALTFAVAMLTFAHRPAVPMAAAWAADPSQLLLPVMTEVFIGGLLGLGVHIVLAALALAGRLLDVQIGFAIGSLFDPVTRMSSNVLGSLVSLLGVTLFVTSDAHLQLAQLVSQSLDVLPLGEFPLLDEPLRPILAAGAMFSIGLAFAAPVAIALLLADVLIAVVSRNMPQINVLIVAMPVKIVIGYAVLAFSVLGWGALFRQGFAETAALGIR